jgi:hypothetical protein
MSPHIPQKPLDPDEPRVIERPDGFYWQSPRDGREYGPFPTVSEALQDSEQSDEPAFEPGETLEEARAEIGIADWIDPDTGEPAEEDGTRTEEH